MIWRDAHGNTVGSHGASNCDGDIYYDPCGSTAFRPIRRCAGWFPYPETGTAGIRWRREFPLEGQSNAGLV